MCEIGFRPYFGKTPLISKMLRTMTTFEEPQRGYDLTCQLLKSTPDLVGRYVAGGITPCVRTSSTRLTSPHNKTVSPSSIFAIAQPPLTRRVTMLQLLRRRSNQRHRRLVTSTPFVHAGRGGNPFSQLTNCRCNFN
jgi:hypothetical protein